MGRDLGDLTTRGGHYSARLLRSNVGGPVHLLGELLGDGEVAGEGEAFEVWKLVVEALVLGRDAKVEGGVHMVGTWVDGRESSCPSAVTRAAIFLPPQQVHRLAPKPQ